MMDTGYGLYTPHHAHSTIPRLISIPPAGGEENREGDDAEGCREYGDVEGCRICWVYLMIARLFGS